MKLKKALSLMLTVLSFNSLASSSGTIIIHGGISENTCEITPSDEYKLVYLPVIGKNTLVSQDAVAGNTSYQINLEKCPATLSKAGLFFEAGSSVFPDTGLVKAYKLGNTVPSGNSSAFPAPLDTPASNAAYLRKVLDSASDSSSSVSDNLAFELLDGDGKIIKAGDQSQRTQNGLFVGLTASSGNASGTFYGSVRYKKYGAAAPVSGYYFSHVGFTIQYP